MQLCDSNCVHGEWKCRKATQCEQKPQSCTIAADSLGRRIQSDCPRGFWCKVQIPGIPDAGIPEVAVCVPGKPTSTLIVCFVSIRRGGGGGGGMMNVEEREVGKTEKLRWL